MNADLAIHPLLLSLDRASSRKPRPEGEELQKGHVSFN